MSKGPQIHKQNRQTIMNDPFIRELRISRHDDRHGLNKNLLSSRIRPARLVLFLTRPGKYFRKLEAKADGLRKDVKQNWQAIMNDRFTPELQISRFAVLHG